MLRGGMTFPGFAGARLSSVILAAALRDRVAGPAPVVEAEGVAVAAGRGARVLLGAAAVGFFLAGSGWGWELGVDW